ncbi:MAG: FtsX-like permease family protein [Pseudomonadales bacterium]
MTALALPAPRAARLRGVSTAALAWRNLWRNRRRTWLTAGGIGFAVWLMVFAVSTQDGGFEVMIDNSARLISGHVQLQHPEYRDDPALDHALTGVDALVRQALARPHVTAALPRTETFALASVGERSFGVQVMGVRPEAEAAASSLTTMLSEGRYLAGPGEAFVGAGLARNLQLTVGDQVVLLGTAREGGVAAAVADVVGIFSTGQAALDRALMQISIDDFRSAWDLGGDVAHSVVLLVDRAAASEIVARDLAAPGRVALDWRELMPEAEQTIELKRLSTKLFFALIAVIVAFSVVNTFMMTVFERTQEFGMLMALGMRPGAIFRLLSVEALWLAVLGVGLGLGASGVLVAVLSITGIPLPADAVEIMARYNMPERMYPAFSVWAAGVSSLVMLVGTQIAVLLPALRVARLKPVEALRAAE